MTAPEAPVRRPDLAELVDQLTSALRVASRAIEDLREQECEVDLGVFHDGGSESVTLHSLSGELHPTVRQVQYLWPVERVAASFDDVDPVDGSLDDFRVDAASGGGHGS